MMSRGWVSLVGAGPGYPDLLTVRAIERLKAADLVLFDALVAPAVVALAGQAQRFCVGKRAGRKSVRQETIIRLMIRAARRGRRVVRLKCGDPYVLGRGAEEGVALRAAGVPFDVVQGISTAVAAPAGAGIPLTHRGLASGFVVVSGHHDASYRPILGSLEPGSATIVVLMGLAHRRDIASCLLTRGWAPETAAAVVFAAASSRERTWIGTLRTLGDTPNADEAEDPGTIVIGTVVDLHTVLRDVGMSTPAAEGKG